MTLSHATSNPIAASGSKSAGRRAFFEVCAPSDGASWCQSLNDLNATAFHGAAWGRAIEECYGFAPCYLQVAAGWRSRAFLPLFDVRTPLQGKRGIALPFTDRCEPLGLEDLDPAEVRRELIGFGRDRKWRSLEVRGGASTLFAGLPPAATYFGHVLQIDRSEPDLWKASSDSQRRAVRKAQAAGVTVVRETSETAAREFYRLQCLTRRKHGLPPQPWRYFECLHRQVLEPGAGAIYLAKHGPKPIAGAVFLSHGSSVIYKHGASDEAHLACRGNNFLMWQAILDFAKAGVRQLDLGRTDLHSDGLRRYKMGFGATEQTFSYYRFDYRQDAFVEARGGRLARCVRPFFRVLPVPVARLLGSLAYRHAA